MQDIYNARTHHNNIERTNNNNYSIVCSDIVHDFDEDIIVTLRKKKLGLACVMGAGAVRSSVHPIRSRHQYQSTSYR